MGDEARARRGSSSSGVDVRAAGGLVVRPGRNGLEVVVIQRPKYDDWSFPKGKLDPGESYRDAAIREVKEETGLRCRPGLELPPIRYRDTAGRSKLVRYWVMDVEAGSIHRRAPDREVDEIRWVEFDRAATLLTYSHDRRLLSKISP